MSTRATRPITVAGLTVLAIAVLALIAALGSANAAGPESPGAQASVRPRSTLAGLSAGTATPTATAAPARVVRVTRVPVTFAPVPPTVTPTPMPVVDGTLTLRVSAHDGTTVTQTWAWSTSRANAPAIAPVPMSIALGPSAVLEIRLSVTQTRSFLCRGPDDRSTTYGRQFAPELYPTQPWRECFRDVLIEQTLIVPTGSADPLTRSLALGCTPVDDGAPACGRILQAFGGTATPRWVSVPLATITFTRTPATPTPAVLVQRSSGPTATPTPGEGTPTG